MALAIFQSQAVDDGGNVLASASVEVRNEATLALASLFSDRAGTTPLGNPFTSDSDGYFAFYVTGGAYKVTVTKDTDTRIWRYVAVGLNAESDTSGVSTFLSLTDTPDTYAGQATKSVRVNAGATALEFFTLGAGTGDVVGPGSATDNAIVRFDLATGKLVQNSTAILADAGSLTLAPTASTLTQGLLVSQSASGASAASLQFNYINVTSDVADTDGSVISALKVRHSFGGGASDGQRHAFFVQSILSSATAPASDNSRFHTAGTFSMQADDDDGGTGGSPKGGLYSIDASILLNTNGTNYIDNWVLRADSFTAAATSVKHRVGLCVTDFISSVQGSGTDAAILINGLGANVGWGHGLLFKAVGSLDASASNPMAATGTLIASSGADTVVGGVDFTSYNFSGNAFASPGWAINGNGDVMFGSGKKIDWNAGNAILLHSSGILTVTVGDLRVTTAGTNSASVVTLGGTQTLTAKTLTSPTIATPTITTSATVPLLIGGTGTGSSITLQSTSGVGTTDFIDAMVGNNGAVRGFRITSAGVVVYGGGASAALIGGNTARMQINSTSITDIAAFSIAQFTNDAQGPNIAICKSRDTTVGGFATALAASDVLGAIDFRGSDGVIDRPGARITVTVPSGLSWSSGDAPAEMTFRTTPDGSATLAIALTIQSTQILKFGTASFQANGAGTVTISNLLPAGAATATITKWLRIDDASGVDSYIPVWQ